MWSKTNLSISLSLSICCVMALVGALPMHIPRYNKLGHSQPQLSNSSRYNDSLAQPTVADRPEPTPTSTPQFEYALLGQDPEDQHWYRVSLTPTGGKSGYRAQFSTRKTPPYDAQVAHKHDKTIKDLLNFLEKSEEHNLQKVYGQLLASEESNEQEAKIKRNAHNELEVVDNEEDLKHLLKTDANRPLLLVGELPESLPTSSQNSSDSSVQNFVYFIKGLK